MTDLASLVDRPDADHDDVFRACFDANPVSWDDLNPHPEDDAPDLAHVFVEWACDLDDPEGRFGDGLSEDEEAALALLGDRYAEWVCDYLGEARDMRETYAGLRRWA